METKSTICRPTRSTDNEKLSKKGMRCHSLFLLDPKKSHLNSNIMLMEGA